MTGDELVREELASLLGVEMHPLLPTAEATEIAVRRAVLGPTPIPRRRWRGTRWVAALAAGAALAVPTAAFADGSKPGDLLYRVDLLLEDLVGLFAVGDGAELGHQLRVAAERLDEGAAAAAGGDSEGAQAALDRAGAALAAASELNAHDEDTLARLATLQVRHANLAGLVSGDGPPAAGPASTSSATDPGADATPPSSASPAATAPGQSGETPGATAPGQSGETPGATAPGQSGETPGATAPGQSGAPAPGQSGETPGAPRRRPRPPP